MSQGFLFMQCYLDPNVFQNIFCYVSQKKKSHTELEQHEGE